MMGSSCALVRKLVKALALLLVWKMALVSTSVESAAIDVWMLVHQEVITPLRSPTCDCMDLLSGRMLANTESV